jgi:hypothetical protein
MSVDSGPGVGEGSASTRPPRVPRWLKLSAVAVALVLLLALAAMLLAGGEHSPQRHLSDLLPPGPAALTPADPGHRT